MNTAYNGHYITFNDSFLSSNLQGQPSTFAKALECMLIQNDRTIISRNMKNLDDGVLNKVPVDLCHGKTELALMSIAINKINKLAYEDKTQFPETIYFKPEEYIARLDVSVR